MLKGKSSLWLFLSLTLGLSSYQASAYDEDTHFYATYAMARFAGIGHDVAAKIALSAQWMDENYLTDPTSMVLDVPGGIHKRRLLHFPSDRKQGKVGQRTQDSTFGFGEFKGIKKYIAEKIVEYIEKPDDEDSKCMGAPEEDLITAGSGAGVDDENGKKKFNPRDLIVYTQTMANSEFASGLLREGLREGNLMKAAASLHTIEDSFAHAGVSAELGHTQLWHWPDRPFADVPKYFRMTSIVFKALVAIRAQLPESSLDCRSVPARNCDMDGGWLAEQWKKNKDVVDTVSDDVLTREAYTKQATQFFIKMASDPQVDYFRPSKLPQGVTFESILLDVYKDHTGALDTYDILERFIIQLFKLRRDTGGEFFNVKHIVEDLGLVSNKYLSAESYINSLGRKGGMDGGGYREFSQRLVRRLLRGYIPMPLDNEHKEEVEDDKSLPRGLEMRLRVEAMQRLIQKLFNMKQPVVFVGNNTKDQEGFVQEILGRPEAKPVIEDAKPNVTYVTFSAEEKKKFSYLIFNYLYPSMGDQALTDLAKGFDNISTAFFKTGAEVKLMLTIKPYLRCYARDLAKAHLVLEGDERDYQNEDSWEDHKSDLRSRENRELYPKFLTLKDVWTESDLKQQTGMQLR